MSTLWWAAHGHDDYVPMPWLAVRHHDRSRHQRSSGRSTQGLRGARGRRNRSNPSLTLFTVRQFDLNGAIGWLNSPSLSPKSLRGKVVLVDFWTYTCINSLRPVPYVKSWAAKYKDAGLVVIGVHTPEFSFAREPRNVETALRALNVTYPIPIDSNYSIWKAFSNEYWPAQYFIDGHGRIRYHHFGQVEYTRCERMIRELLRQNGATGLDGSTVTVSGDGIEAAPSADERSPETYIGYQQAERFSSVGRLARNSNKAYALSAQLALNRWASPACGR